MPAGSSRKMQTVALLARRRALKRSRALGHAGPPAAAPLKPWAKTFLPGGNELPSLRIFCSAALARKGGCMLHVHAAERAEQRPRALAPQGAAGRAHSPRKGCTYRAAGVADGARGRRRGGRALGGRRRGAPSHLPRGRAIFPEGADGGTQAGAGAGPRASRALGGAWGWPWTQTSSRGSPAAGAWTSTSKYVWAAGRKCGNTLPARCTPEECGTLRVGVSISCRPCHAEIEALWQRRRPGGLSCSRCERWACLQVSCPRRARWRSPRSLRGAGCGGRSHLYGVV